LLAQTQTEACGRGAAKVVQEGASKEPPVIRGVGFQERQATIPWALRINWFSPRSGCYDAKITIRGYTRKKDATWDADRAIMASMASLVGSTVHAAATTENRNTVGER
jgi:hypothetical protein